jgi:hypothetical protein
MTTLKRTSTFCSIAFERAIIGSAPPVACLGAGLEHVDRGDAAAAAGARFRLRDETLPAAMDGLTDLALASSRSTRDLTLA